MKTKKILLKRRQRTWRNALWRKTPKSEIAEAQMANYSQRFFSLQDNNKTKHLKLKPSQSSTKASGEDRGTLPCLQ